MNVGLLGSGDVARTLASGFLKHGHEVTMGTREPAKLADWARQNPKGQIGSLSDAARFGELLVLAVGWEAADMGKAEAARAIESLCILWCIPGFLRNAWVHAFKLLA